MVHALLARQAAALSFRVLLGKPTGNPCFWSLEPWNLPLVCKAGLMFLPYRGFLPDFPNSGMDPLVFERETDTCCYDML